jgi:hypothetical protein
LDVQKRVEELKARTETKRAVKRILELVKEICTYIQKHTSDGILGKSYSRTHLRNMIVTTHIGNLFGGEYREKVDEYKTELAQAKESFDRSIGLEIFKAVDGIGRFHVKKLELKLI